VNWILARYFDDNFRYLEDIGKVTDLLSFYEKVKPRLDVSMRDINKIESVEELYDIVDTLKEKEVQTTSNREKERSFEKDLIQSGEAEIYYNSADIKIIIPRTERASCFFGRNTRWCTAAENDNRFDEYHTNGMLYIILFKKENKRWQFHFHTAQFMDERDEELSLEQVQSVGRLFPGTYIDPNISEERQINLVKEHAYMIKYMTNPSEKVQMAAIRKNVYVIQSIKNPSEEVQLYVVNENPIMITSISNPTERVQLIALKKDPDFFITHPVFFKHIKNKTIKVIEYYNQITKSNES
jgi:hypothetical protein